MKPQCTRDDLEAYFGAFRLIINGGDIRGFFRREDADNAAAQIRASRPHFAVLVRDNRSEYERDIALIAARQRDDVVDGDLGSVPL